MLLQIVPNRFVKHFAGKLSGTIKLESPNGNRYDVEVTEHHNKMMFRHGWEAFVDAHHIEENDSLLFRNIETSVFEVVKKCFVALAEKTPKVLEKEVYILLIFQAALNMVPLNHQEMRELLGL